MKKNFKYVPKLFYRELEGIKNFYKNNVIQKEGFYQNIINKSIFTKGVIIRYNKF